MFLICFFGENGGSDKAIFGVVKGDPPSPPSPPPLKGNPATPKGNHPNGNIFACYYFIKTKIAGQKVKTKMNFISFYQQLKLMQAEFVSRRSKISFRVSCKQPLNQSFYNDIERSQKVVLVYTFICTQLRSSPSLKSCLNKY